MVTAINIIIDVKLSLLCKMYSHLFTCKTYAQYTERKYKEKIAIID